MSSRCKGEGVNGASDLERGKAASRARLESAPMLPSLFGLRPWGRTSPGGPSMRGLIVAGLVLTTSVPWAEAEPKES